jgi:predicted helicase
MAFVKLLKKNFSSIYLFNLRGNQRTSGELSRKEGGKIFGSGSRTPISITLLINNPADKAEKATIHYHDIGDYLSQQEKLDIIKNFGSISNSEMKWKTLKPNEQGDWINLRNDSFDNFIEIIPKKKYDQKTQSFFVLNSNGMQSNRDAWVYNFSSKRVSENVEQHISFYNSEVERLRTARTINPETHAEDFKNNDSKKISWSSSLVSQLERLNKVQFSKKSIVDAGYRPYTKEKLYIGDKMIHRRGQFESFFPNGSENENRVICVGSGNYFSLLITNRIVDSNFSGYLQALPLFYFEVQEKRQSSLFDAAGNSEYIRRDGVSDFIFERAKKQYGKSVSKEDIFYYVYGILHSEDYRQEFANDLKKMLPRIPLVEAPKDFWAFSKAGRALAELHINYEIVPAYEGVTVKGVDSDFFKVEKMRFPKKDQKDTILYNSKVTISNIPEEAYEYIVNGKSAIEWIMERYRVTVDLDSKGVGSGIKNDPNDWAEEVGNPRYILDLVLSIINVSVQTVEIVKGLPKLDFGEGTSEIKLYPNLEDNESYNVAAEPGNKE